MGAHPSSPLPDPISEGCGVMSLDVDLNTCHLSLLYAATPEIELVRRALKFTLGPSCIRYDATVGTYWHRFEVDPIQLNSVPSLVVFVCHALEKLYLSGFRCLTSASVWHGKHGATFWLERCLPAVAMAPISEEDEDDGDSGMGRDTFSVACVAIRDERSLEFYGLPSSLACSVRDRLMSFCGDDVDIDVEHINRENRHMKVVFTQPVWRLPGKRRRRCGEEERKLPSRSKGLLLDLINYTERHRWPVYAVSNMDSRTCLLFLQHNPAMPDPGNPRFLLGFVEKKKMLAVNCPHYVCGVMEKTVKRMKGKLVSKKFKRFEAASSRSPRNSVFNTDNYYTDDDDDDDSVQVLKLKSSMFHMHNDGTSCSSGGGEDVVRQLVKRCLLVVKILEAVSSQGYLPQVACNLYSNKYDRSSIMFTGSPGDSGNAVPVFGVMLVGRRTMCVVNCSEGVLHYISTALDQCWRPRGKYRERKVERFPQCMMFTLSGKPWRKTKNTVPYSLALICQLIRLLHAKNWRCIAADLDIFSRSNVKRSKRFDSQLFVFAYDPVSTSDPRRILLHTNHPDIHWRSNSWVSLSGAPCPVHEVVGSPSSHQTRGVIGRLARQCSCPEISPVVSSPPARQWSYPLAGAGNLGGGMSGSTPMYLEQAHFRAGEAAAKQQRGGRTGGAADRDSSSIPGTSGGRSLPSYEQALNNNSNGEAYIV